MLRNYDRRETQPANPDVSLDPMTFRVDFVVSLSQHEGDPSDFITVYEGNIIGMMEDDDERKIGTLTLYMVERARAMNEGVSLFEVMDCLDGDSCDCFANLFDQETEQLEPKVEHLISENRATQWDILLIERLELNPECRGRGLGKEIALRAIQKFGENCGIITCVPVPLQFSGLGPKRKTKRDARGSRTGSRVLGERRIRPHTPQRLLHLA